MVEIGGMDGLITPIISSLRDRRDQAKRDPRPSDMERPRNLLYTGITRGRKLVVLVGQKQAIGMAAKG